VEAVMSKRFTAGLFVSLALASACDDSQRGYEVADRDFSGFRDVYPVLIRDCGFPTCHGSEERMFRIYGPGRARLSDDLRAFEMVTGDELSLSLSMALSMIDAEHPERSLLLKKPLALEAGGTAHGGIDDFGRNVYRTTQDEGYEIIQAWVLAEPEPEDEE
jgi:hypothetical protein